MLQTLAALYYESIFEGVVVSANAYSAENLNLNSYAQKLVLGTDSVNVFDSTLPSCSLSYLDRVKRIETRMIRTLLYYVCSIGKCGIFL